MSDEISYKAFINALKSYITESERIIQGLLLVKEFVEDCHQRSNKAKTVGAVGGVAATVSVFGLLFAPLTGGLSAVATGVALGGSIGSAGVGVMVTVGDHQRAKEAKKRIEDCQTDHERSVNQLSDETNKLLKVINQLVEKGFNFDVAIVSTFAFLSKIGQSGTGIIKTVDAVNKIQNALKVGEIQSILAPTGIAITKKLQGGLSVAFPTIEAAARMTPAEIKAYSSLSQGPQLLLGKTLTTVGKVVIVAQVFFTVVDVALLINSWTSDHPLVAPINQFISQLKASIESTQNQINALEIFHH